ncbi:MAG: spore coat associated protein CotJA [Lachnospiraceae bacterium]|nr:spore coat associated protein CotJA [Lachnospiraceae bacterium]MBR1563056.1 spore coat associated protein CotJA [Ruminococcus sp.]
MPVAMAYVPYQQWKDQYEDDVALQRGTIFPCLDKPFLGEEAVKNGNSK